MAQDAGAKVEGIAEAEAKPAPKVYFQDNFDGADLAEHWEVANPDPDAFIVEDGSLILLASSVGGLELETLPNIMTLVKELPKGDWTVTVDVSGELQTGGEAFWLALYDDHENFVGTQVYTARYGCTGAVAQQAIKRTEGKEVKDPTTHLAAGIGCGFQKTAEFFGALAMPIQVRLAKVGRRYSSDLRFADDLGDDGKPLWRRGKAVSSLRAPKKLVFGVGQNAPTQSETLFMVDSLKIEVPEED